MAETEQAVEQDAKTTQAQEVELGEAVDSAKGQGEGNLDLLLDITMSITVNLGDAQVPIKQLLQLGPGSVLQMDKLIDEPAELYVQGNKFATGDIVVVDGRFAIRIKEVLGI
ncbi:Flagellar motor switch protein FliN [Anaerohalosphaera lusitana]|uniref:Flagellar motor switch protein FliN n=1 Tax=Anaerohalosphaera lusitana TaxID=1936003 RepID=A0A1U9NG71_9BACT|nr:FliM/FliN family flagellar motor switch protein [Anaerohalosphaera lusitana]AQT66932.1 Flagellar motor switch protein FliN [Anaerohalosphaera lusitana]